MRSSTIVKLVDCYAAAFFSSAKGVALFGDLGIDFLKLEDPRIDLGLGFRLDTGVNIGEQGARGVPTALRVEPRHPPRLRGRGLSARAVRACGGGGGAQCASSASAARP